MLTGKNPGEPPYIEERFIEKDGRVPAKYREFLKKCLNSNPGERFPNASVCLQTFMELPNKKHKKNKEKIVYKKSIWVSNYSIHIH